jgi:hypothetical protein
MALAAMAVAQETTTLEVRMSSDPQGLHSKRITRCGSRLASISTGLDSSGRRELVVMNGQRAWVVDETTRTGRYLEDQGEASDIRMPIHSDSSVARSGAYVEWGQELSLLKRSAATSSQRIERGGVAYVFSVDSVPRGLLVVRGIDTIASYVYTSYRSSGVCDPESFAPAPDVDFARSAIEDLNVIFKDWTKPVERRRIPSCKAQGVVARINLMRKAIGPSKEMPFIGFLAGMNEKLKEQERIATLSFAIREPHRTGLDLFRKSIRFNVDSLRKLKISSPGQFDFVWGHYYATRSLDDLKFIASTFTKNDTGFAENSSKEFILATKRAATAALQGNLATLDYLAEDLTKVGQTVRDTTTHLYVSWLLQPKDKPSSK